MRTTVITFNISSFNIKYISTWHGYLFCVFSAPTEGWVNPACPAPVPSVLPSYSKWHQPVRSQPPSSSPSLTVRHHQKGWIPRRRRSGWIRAWRWSGLGVEEAAFGSPASHMQYSDSYNTLAFHCVVRLFGRFPYLPQMLWKHVHIYKSSLISDINRGLLYSVNHSSTLTA